MPPAIFNNPSKYSCVLQLLLKKISISAITFYSDFLVAVKSLQLSGEKKLIQLVVLFVETFPGIFLLSFSYFFLFLFFIDVQIWMLMLVFLSNSFFDKNWNLC